MIPKPPTNFGLDYAAYVARFEPSALFSTAPHCIYQAEFMRPLFDQREGKQFIRQLKALQDVFGYINDVRMTPCLAEIQRERQVGSEAAHAASYAAGHHDAEAAHVWHRAGKAWRKLERSPRFWA